MGLGAFTLTSRTAQAYSIETIVTRGCHEEITGDALRAVRSALPDLAPPLSSVGEDRALIEDVPFTVPDDLDDIGSVGLLLGARDNDVKSFAAISLDQLAALNADPATQMEHCLRTANQDEPSGSRAAIDDCRAYIRETLLSALDGLDSAGRPDGTKRERLEVTLAIRGQIEVDVPIFYLRAGRALHAIQDSFTHTFRNVADRHKVTIVLNWIDYADNTLDEGVDGPAHMQELDRCDDPDDLRTERRHLAIEASTAALRGLLDATADTAAKASAVDAVLDKYISFDTNASCTKENRWCDAPELAYQSSGCGCTLASSGPPRTSASWILLAFGLVVGRKRARGGRRCREVKGRAPAEPSSWIPRAASGILLSTALAMAPRTARAEEPAPASGAEEPAPASGAEEPAPASGAEEPAPAKGAAAPSPEATEEPVPAKAGEGGPLNALAGDSKAATPHHKDAPGAFFGRLALGASYDKPAVAGGAGLRYQFSKPWMIGIDGELNPWIASPPTRVRAGALNTYASLVRRFQLKSDSVNIRTTAALGASFLLIDLVGAPKGSVGPFFGLSFLGVEWKVSPGFFLTVDPSYIVFPVPHLTGAPFGYMQYRFQLGLEFGG